MLGIFQKVTKDAALTRCTTAIQEYDIKLNFLPGKENIFSDPFSRLVDVKNGCVDVAKELDEDFYDKVLITEEDEAEEGQIDNQLNSLIPMKVP